MRFMLLSLLLLSLQCKSQKKDMAKLIYVGDPMCSWCYGIGEEFSHTLENLKDEVKVEVVLGGLRPFNTQTMLDLKEFLTHHWEDVNKRSGQEFRFDILDTDLKYDTEPACRAVVVARSIKQSSALAYFKLLQKRFYFENKNPLVLETFLQIAEELNIDKQLFQERFNSDEYKMLVKEDFENANQLGVNSFPTILLQVGDNTHLIAKGYAESSNMVEKIQNLLASEKQK